MKTSYRLPSPDHRRAGVQLTCFHNLEGFGTPQRQLLHAVVALFALAG